MLHSTAPTLVLGSGGLLGRHVVCEYARSGESIIALTHKELDVTDEASIVRLLDQARPPVVINCAALCHFQKCEDFPEQSAAVNLDAPITLARLTAERGIRLVHFSTDYIFDGKSDRPYREQDVPHPLSVYGTHKAAVEKAFAAYPHHLLLRVAWLFGAGGKTFMSLLPDLLMERETIEVASGKLGACLHAGYAAQMIRRLVNQGSTGLINLVHRGEVSWEGFAHECLQQLQARGYDPACRLIIEVPLDQMAILGGSRPLYSVLDVTLLSKTMRESAMDWRDGLSQFLDETHPAGRTVLA